MRKCGASLISQCHHWIDPRGASRGDVTGQKPDQCKQQGHSHPTKVAGSVEWTSYSQLTTSRVNARAAITPQNVPTSTSIIDCFTRSLSTSFWSAPIAIRMPISCVRLATEYEITL